MDLRAPTRNWATLELALAPLEIRIAAIGALGVL